jgi:Tol biopolymer transport system component
MPANPNGVGELFRRDLQTGTTILVSADAAGTGAANGEIYAASITTDGRFVAFTSTATNLVNGVTVGHPNEIFGDLYIRDLQSGTTRLVSVDTTGKLGANADVTDPVISDDGQVVAFMSTATNLVAGDTAAVSNIFVRNLATGVTEQLSSHPGDTAGAYFDPPVMSAYGRYVAYTSNATDLVPGLTINNGFQNVFVTDLQAGTTTMLDINAVGTAAGNVGGSAPSISSDGRYVAFESFSSDLIPGGTTKFPNVYVRDLQAHTTSLVSVNDAGTGDAGGSAPIISGNGQFVAFQSTATDLVGRQPSIDG